MIEAGDLGGGECLAVEHRGEHGLRTESLHLVGDRACQIRRWQAWVLLACLARNRQLDQVLILPEVLYDAPFCGRLRTRQPMAILSIASQRYQDSSCQEAPVDHHQCIVRHGSPEKRAQGDFAVFVGAEFGAHQAM